jgi:hypothetical protein
VSGSRRARSAAAMTPGRSPSPRRAGKPPATSPRQGAVRRTSRRRCQWPTTAGSARCPATRARRWAAASPM